MVPHLVFEAEKKIKDEFLLASIAMKAARRMHQPGTRTEETASRVFEIVAKGRSVASPAKTRATETILPLIPEDGSVGPIGGTVASESNGRVQAPSV
jgi:hypothetical protein